METWRVEREGIVLLRFVVRCSLFVSLGLLSVPRPSSLSSLIVTFLIHFLVLVLENVGAGHCHCRCRVCRARRASRMNECVSCVVCGVL
jgi:hypothetical protein